MLQKLWTSGKNPVLFINKQNLEFWRKRTPNKEHTLYITHNAYSMQIKKNKSSGMQMKYNVMIECEKRSHFLFDKSKNRSTKGLFFRFDAFSM